MKPSPAKVPTPLRRKASAIVALLVLALIAVGCGGSSPTSPGGDGGSSTARFAGGAVSPPQPAPALRLHDYLGEPVGLGQLKGKAVLVTFIYTHCPDTCPLIVSHIRTALALLGPKAKEVQVIAVSTDPRGDTRRTVRAFVAAHGMVGRMKYLIGDRSELGRVWKDWNIVAKPAKAGRDLVEHSALVYGIAADGKLTTLYPANFSPRELAHDVPLLAET